MLRPIRLLATCHSLSHRYASIVERTEQSFQGEARSFCFANRSERPIPGPSIRRNPCGSARTLNPASLTFGWRRNRRLHGLVTMRWTESRELDWMSGPWA